MHAFITGSSVLYFKGSFVNGIDATERCRLHNFVRLWCHSRRNGSRPVVGRYRPLVSLDSGSLNVQDWMRGSLITLGVISAVWLVNILEKLAEERRKAELLEQGSTVCPLCDGTGYINCLCTKWTFPSSNKNRSLASCDRCHGTLKEPCPRCGGGGLLHPIPVPAKVPVK
eukprot:jgi/Galph1/5530/GphlegSOOS_G4182.1